jgi:NAD+ kinase
VILVAKRSSYRRYVQEGRDRHAYALIKAGHASVKSWVPAHREHMRTLEQVERVLESAGASVVIRHGAYNQFETKGAALVVTVGGDGTLLGASHNVGSTPVLGINSDARHSVGFFCAGHRENAERLLSRALDGTLHGVALTRMRVTANGNLVSQRVLNEALFSHLSPAATSRYLLRLGRIQEEHRSSGFWIGPAAGSTAAQRSAGGKILPFGSRKLQLVVREPYVPVGMRYRLLRIFVPEGAKLVAVSKMVDGCLFLDGPYQRLTVQLADQISFEASDEPLNLLGLRRRQRKRD